MTLTEARNAALAAITARNSKVNCRQFTIRTYSILFGTTEIRQRDLTPAQLETLRQHYIWVAQQASA